jgi:hypothetical protein
MAYGINIKLGRLGSMVNDRNGDFVKWTVFLLILCISLICGNLLIIINKKKEKLLKSTFREARKSEVFKHIKEQ